MKMVLAEKGNDNARNGRRSRGPSPNGHGVADSTSEDESGKVFNSEIIFLLFSKIVCIFHLFLNGYFVLENLLS